MKPIHEQTWGRHTEGGRAYVVDEEGRMVCETRGVDGADLARGISAGPDVARALLMQATTNAHGKPCWCSTPRTAEALHQVSCTEATNALQKMGVLK